MAHSHAHAMPKSGYYLEQLCTVGACAALGAVTVLMWQMNKLSLILAPSFHLPVLLGGIGLIALSVVRGAALWVEAGGVAKHDHGHHDHEHHHHHEHEGACDHDHAECDHDHVHEWTPAKYSVLLLPIVLFLLGLPNQGFSTEYISGMLTKQSLDETKAVASKGGAALKLGFRELGDAAHEPAAREQLEGKTGQVTGMLMRIGNDRQFTLFRIKVRCCAADAVPMQVRIFSPANITQFPDRTWVEVKGTIQFFKLKNMEKYIPVLIMQSVEDMQPTAAESEFDFQ